VLALHACNALFIAFIAVYRSELYQLPASAWAFSAAAGVLGVLAPLGLPTGLRTRLFAGMWPLVFVIPFVALLLSPSLIPSAVTVGPFFFCAGASLTTCVVAVSNVSRRKRSLRAWLARDPGVQSRLETYFAIATPLAEESSRRSRPLAGALRAQAWISTKSSRRRAAELLREWAEFLKQNADTERSIEPPLEGMTTGSQESSESLRAALLTAAARLESGRRIFRWRTWLASLSARDVDNDRNAFYVLDRLARLHGVARPAWFRARRRMLAHSLLTETDVTPRWDVAAPFAKAGIAVVAATVAASIVVATATAETPLDDARRLPTVAGPSAESRIEPRFSRVAGLLAGRRAEVRCWSRADWKRLASQRTSWIHRGRRLGRWSAYAKKERVHMSPDICASLARLSYQQIPVQRDVWPGALAWSVAMLAHESQHVKGIYNEATAECYGMQSITAAAEALGRTEAEGRYLAWLYWTEAYPKHSDPAYLSDECRDGGRLDLRPQSAIWP
jgi:hypothetical protein